MCLDDPIIGAKSNDVLLGLDLNVPNPLIGLADLPDEPTLSGPERGLLVGPRHHKELPVREVAQGERREVDLLLALDLLALEVPEGELVGPVADGEHGFGEDRSNRRELEAPNRLLPRNRGLTTLAKVPPNLSNLLLSRPCSCPG